MGHKYKLSKAVSAIKVSGSKKQQSAMEYLTTYGWMLLIIVIVIIALFSLGVTYWEALAPKALTGSCSVLRPNGPGTVQSIQLVGACNNNIPKFSMSAGATTLTAIALKFAPSITSAGSNSISITGWAAANSLDGGALFSYVNNNGNQNIYANPFPSYFQEMDPWCTPNDYPAFPADPNAGVWLSGSYAIDAYGGTQCYLNSGGIYLNEFIFYAMTFNGVDITECASSSSSYIKCITIPADIGTETISADSSFCVGGCEAGIYWDGYISNVQLYNTSLSENSLTALYEEGIGGAPIDLRHLVGWWPLDGSTLDYSGNNNNLGVYSGIISYSTTWWNSASYTAP